MNILVPSAPRRLRITQTMWEDFLCDPVLAAWIIMGYRLDAFQSVRLRHFWWVQDVIDVSGLASGKTIVDWIFANLRAVLIPDQEIGVFYPTHSTGKETFWNYYDWCQGPIFRSQKGRMIQEDDDAPTRKRNSETKSGGTWKVEFLNGNRLYLPAPDIAKDSMGQASKGYNTLIIEEFTMIDERSDAIDKQLLGRARRQNWNGNHPIWGNHRLLTAPSKTRMHASDVRVQGAERLARSGDPGWAVLRFCYKDFSDEPVDGGKLEEGGRRGKTFKDKFRDDRMIASLRLTKQKAEFLGEALGVSAVSGSGWFTEQAMTAAVEAGEKRGVKVEMGRVE